jgi:hypothetical protein
MLKFKHKKKPPKKPPTAIKKGELNSDLSEPVKAARVDWILEMYGSLLARITIIRKVMAGRSADTKRGLEAIPGVSNAEAYRYYRLAMRINTEEDAATRDEKRRWHRAQLIQMARQARNLKQPGTAALILERVATFDGLGTAALPDAGAKRPDELTDEALAQRIADELARKAKKPDDAS